MVTVNPGDSPSVVFIAQLGTGGTSWRPVINLLTTNPTTVTYDRPTGNAPPRPAPNPASPYSAFADELAALLDEHGVTEPAVVVAHSVGSLIARVFADRHRGRVAGMVHVDGSIPRLSLWPVGPTWQSADGDGSAATDFDLAAGEIEIVEAVAPSVPTAVVTRTPGRWSDGWLDRYPRADPLWTAYQRQLASFAQAPLVLAEDAGHQIPREAPALVAYVVDAIVTAARTGQRWRPDQAALAAIGGTLDPEVVAAPGQRRTQRLR
jgi:pimeloyl-ACP methyl ester carboxylesterase